MSLTPLDWNLCDFCGSWVPPGISHEHSRGQRPSPFAEMRATELAHRNDEHPFFVLSLSGDEHAISAITSLESLDTYLRCDAFIAWASALQVQRARKMRGASAARGILPSDAFVRVTCLWRGLSIRISPTPEIHSAINAEWRRLQAACLL